MSEPPRDWFHHYAKQGERMDRLERRLADLEAKLAAITPPAPTNTQTEAQAP
jgi:BMFP domain-containing protein YqiC